VTMAVEPTGTPILPSRHVHYCTGCPATRQCDAACVIRRYGAGLDESCPACRRRLAPVVPHALRMGALSGIVDNVVTVLRGFGYSRREIVQALDGARAELARKRGGGR
jgi:hypothetical protein